MIGSWRCAAAGFADTEGFYTLVQERILARYGKTFDWSLKAKMMGKKAIEAARVFVEEMGLDGLLTPEGFLEEREEMLQELFPTAELMPGSPKHRCIRVHASPPNGRRGFTTYIDVIGTCF